MKDNNLIRRYSIRKLSTGVASVCMGLFCIVGGTVYADEVGTVTTADTVLVEETVDSEKTEEASKEKIDNLEKSVVEDSETSTETDMLPEVATFSETNEVARSVLGENKIAQAVVLSVTNAITIEEGTTLNPRALIDIASIDGINASSQVVVTGSVDKDTAGIYGVTYTLTAEDGTVQTATAQITVVSTQGDNFLETDRNYYEDATIDKSWLDIKIKDSVAANVLTNLTNSAAKGLIQYQDGMTYNEFYLANNLSPEDQFSRNNGDAVKLPDGTANLINTHSRFDITQVVPANLIQRISGVPNSIYANTYFSRLTAGNPTVKYSELGVAAKPDVYGYGENGTVNDYMLTGENNIVIPTRYNQNREDIWLTLRGGMYATKGTQAYLTAIDQDGNHVLGKDENGKYYLNTITTLGTTPNGYSKLGFLGKLGLTSAIGTANRQLNDVSIEDFNRYLNENLRTLQNTSGAQSIAPKFGGQIQVIGFYRDSKLDESYKANLASRLSDSDNQIDVVYFVYASGISGTNSANIADVPVEYREELYTRAGITNPTSTDLLKLYGPNISKFKIETTRPFFSDFGDLVTPTVYDPTKIDFNTVIGMNSFVLNDQGVDHSGDKIGIDVTRVRVRVNNQSTAFTLAELEKELNKSEYAGQVVNLTYVYAAPDAQDSILGLLPNEIGNNLGAYAVPISRTITVVGASFQEIHEYFTRKDGNLNDSPDSTDTRPQIERDATNETIRTVKDDTPDTGTLKGYKFFKIIQTVADLDGSNPISTELTSDGSESTINFETGKKITYTYQYVRDIATPLPLNQAPKVVAEGRTITQGSSLNIRDLLVSASDPEDGNYPLDRVELVTDGGFTSEVPGTYAVTFKVTDNDGASNTITVEVIVKRKVNPESKVTPETKIETKVTKNIPQSAVLPKTGSQDWNYLRGLAAIFISSGLLFIGKDFSKKKE